MSYYIIEYTSKEQPRLTGTFHVARSRTTKFLERVAHLISLGFIVNTQLID